MTPCPYPDCFLNKPSNTECPYRDICEYHKSVQIPEPPRLEKHCIPMLELRWQHLGERFSVSD